MRGFAVILLLASSCLLVMGRPQQVSDLADRDQNPAFDWADLAKLAEYEDVISEIVIDLHLTDEQLEKLYSAYSRLLVPTEEEFFLSAENEEDYDDEEGEDY